MKTKNILTVSIIAMMAVASARADIASTTYVDGQVQSVSSALTTHTGNDDIHVTAADKATWSGKQDVSNMVTATGDTLTEDSTTLGSTTKYPSMATMTSAISEALSDTQGDVSSIQNTMVKHTASTAVGSATVPVYVDQNGNAVAITSYSGTATNARNIPSGSQNSTTFAAIWVE